MVVNGKLDQAVTFIWEIIGDFFSFTFPGTNIPVGLIGLAIASFVFIYRIVILKWFLGVDHD